MLTKQGRCVKLGSATWPSLSGMPVPAGADESRPGADPLERTQTMMRLAPRLVAIGLLLGFAASAQADTRTIARCGRGFLEEVDGYRVLHVKGSPYEMGYQQGTLLKDDIKELVRFLFDVKAKELKINAAGIEVR